MMANPTPLRAAIGANDTESPAAHEVTDENIGTIIGPNLKRLRTRRGHSLETLAKLSGVSRAMLSQIEVGRSVPSINIVFKIARAFDVPFSALLALPVSQKVHILPAREAKTLTSASGEFSTRALFPFDAERRTEFYELRLGPGGTEMADPHAAGTIENLIIVRGSIEIGIAGRPYRLQTGDAFQFQADEPHSYRNLGKQEGLIYLVMIYQETLG